MPLPEHISKQQFEKLPDSPGVYYFLDHNGAIIYIGKSIHIKQRVLSHFYASHRETKERKLALATHAFDYTKTAGELSALLLESREIKRHNPLFNRRLRRQRSLYSWSLTEEPANTQAQIVEAQWPPPSSQLTYGLYRSPAQAKKALLDVAQKHQLCCQQLGLEASTRGCFNLQLNRCRGACIGRETASHHKERVLLALASHDASIWPYPSAIAVREHGASQLAVFDRWFFLGEAESIEHATQLCNQANAQLLDRDSYRILLGFLTRGAVDQLTVLDKLHTVNSSL
ncbi:MAG: GIY-YIG nuclease family protein [Oceanicoccus sp.]